MAKTLVLADQSERRRRIAPTDVRAGWRIICGNGDPYDMFWGSAKPEAVESLIADAKANHGAEAVLDLRGRPDEVRDRAYYDRALSPGAATTESEGTHGTGNATNGEAS